MPSNKYLWNEALFRYETRRGVAVPWAGNVTNGITPVSQLFDRQVQASIQRALIIGKQMQAGTMSVAEFQIAMRAEIKSMHTIAGATARGGWAQMSLSDWGRVGAVTRFQYERLNNLGLQLEQGLPTDGRFLQRLVGYIKSSRNTFFNMLVIFLENAGKQLLVARVRNANESCSGDNSCVAADIDHLGFIPLAEMIANHQLGSKKCLYNCLCSYIFMEVDAQ